MFASLRNFSELKWPKIESSCPNFDPYTLSHFDSFLKKRVSLTQKNWVRFKFNHDSIMSQVDSEKIALFLVTQFSSQFISPSHKTESDWLKFDHDWVFESRWLGKNSHITPCFQNLDSFYSKSDGLSVDLFIFSF